MKDNDYNTLGLYYWPRVVPDALYVLALILRAIHSNVNCIQKKKLGLRELKKTYLRVQPGNSRSRFQIQTYLISKLIYFHYSLSAHI